MGANALMCVEKHVAANDDGLTARDAAILEMLSTHDYREALTRCAREHGAAVGRLCMALVGSQAEAQELAQETFVAAFHAFPNYRAEGTVRAFLFGIARHLCARHVETRKRRESKLRLVHDADAHADDASHWLASHERAQQTRTALNTLRPTEREAVVLRFQSELSFREVADASGVDEATARKRVSRALARLRTSLGDA